MVQISVLSSLSVLLFTLFASANVLPRSAVPTSTSGAATSTATGAVIWPTSTIPSCPAVDQSQYAAPSGTFLIECYSDHLGSDLPKTGLVTASFQACLDQCAANPQCQAISWLSGSHKCYMKSKIGTPKVNNLVWGAKWIAGPLPKVVSSSKTSTTSSTTSTTSSTTSTTSSSTSSAPSTTSTTSTSSTQSTTQSTAASSTVSGGVESVFGGATNIPGPTPVVLGPIAPFDTDMSSLDILTPNITAPLFYSGGSNSSNSSTNTGTVAKLAVTFNYTSVPLDHSIYVTTSCSNGVLTAKFNDTRAFAQAQSTWPSTTFLLITADPSCGANGQNAFFLANSVVFSTSSLTAVASGSTVDMVDVFQHMAMDFGSIPNNGSTSAANASAPIVNSCGIPGNSSLNGLPAVACGPTFDQTLDDFLGYYSGDDADFSSVLSVVAPGIAAGSLQRRGFFSSLKKVVAVVAPVVKAVAAKVVQAVAPFVPPVIKQAVAAVATVVNTVVNTVESFLTGNFSQSLNIPINIAPPASQLSTSPWGQQFKFYEYTLGSSDPKYADTKSALKNASSELVNESDPAPGIQMFCVNCGVTGNIQLIGSVSISATQGFYAGSIGMQGNMDAGLYIGINGFAEWQKQMQITILNQGLPGFSIPKVVTIGPSIALEIDATLTVDAVGQILVGTDYSWPSLSASLNVFDTTQSTRSGFSPVVTRKFEVYGDVTATANVALPVTLAFGFDFFGGKWSKEVSLKDVPSITAVAEFSLTANADSTSGAGGSSSSPGISINTNGCNGISWQVSVANEVDFDIGDNTKYTLWQWSPPPFAQGCIGQAVTSSSTSSSSTSTSSTSTSFTSTGFTSTSSTSTTSISSTATTSTSVKQTSTALFSTVLMVSKITTTPTATASFSTVLLVSQITPTATTTSTGSVSTSTSTLNPNTPINCATDDGKTFTDAKGYVYQIQCHTNHGFDAMGYEVASSFQQCIADCYNQQNHDCIAVAWYPTPAGSFPNCYFKGDRSTLPASTSDSNLGYEVDSAVLISAPPCSSMTCPSNDAQYCMSGGEMFKMSCEIAYQTTQLASLTFSTLSQCIDACSSQWPGVCNGVNFYPALSTCYPFAIANNPVAFQQANGGQSAITRTARNGGYGLWKREIDASPKLALRQSSNATNTTSGDVTYASVFDTTNTLSLQAATDGNLYISLSNATQTTNTTFGISGQTIFGDSLDRLLHYYPDNIAAVGASRIRLASWGSIPETATLISLAPVTVGTSTIYVAVDTLGNAFWLYVCAIEDQQDKVFLVNDPTNGAGILQDPGLKFTVTGGVVNDCAPLALAAPSM